MKFNKLFIVIFCTILTVLVFGPGVGFGAPGSCEDLLTTDFGSEVTITSAVTSTQITVVDPSGATTIIPVPEYCDVRGTIWPEQGFDVKLPTPIWNDKLYVIGNGIAAGQIDEGYMISGLAQGFVTAGTDTGHQGSMLDWSFGYPDSGNTNYQEKIDDYCDESIHETTVLAKQIIAAYYDSDPTYSYYVGCSTGGRQGLVEAQRYPGDFDGILIGAPVLQLSEIQMRNIWEAQQLIGPGAIDVLTYPGKFDALADSVMTECDDIDGASDGVIGDPRKCAFDARTDLPACPGDVDADDCFTTAQRNAIYAIYDAPRNSTGDLLTFGQPFGSEAFGLNLFGPNTYGWNGWIVSDNPMVPVLNPLIGAGFVQYVGLDPAPGGAPGSYDFTTFDFDTDWHNVMNNSFTSSCNATDPDLTEFKGLGGKMIHYDGWADQATGPYQSVDYYEKVLNFLGDSETKSFYKLYMIPGMFHCGGGLGCFDQDALFAALVNWVESGVTPTTFTGSGINPAENPRTRPMCPYPEVAVYDGIGDIDDEASFTCQMPSTVISPTTGVSITTSGVTDTIDAGTPPANFTTTSVVSFTATGVSGSADFSIDFPTSLGSDPVIYKVAGTTWGQIYPDNTANGVSNVKLVGGVLTFTMDDNSAFDTDSTLGTIEDPIVVGTISAPSSSQGGGGGGGCFVNSLLAD